MSTSEPTLRNELGPALSHFGFDTHTVDTPAELASLLGVDHYDICVLDASREPEAALAAVARLRHDTGLGIVLLTREDQIETRIHGLLIGADTYLTLPSQPRELAAIMLSVARRMSSAVRTPETLMGGRHMPRPAIHSAAWTLTDDDNLLISPEGVRLDLSFTERLLMAAIADRAGETLSREFIGSLLDESLLQADSARPVARAPQRVSMLISRLRKKSARAGATLPLRVVRGSGYSFVAPLLRPGQDEGAGTDMEARRRVDEFIV